MAVSCVGLTGVAICHIVIVQKEIQKQRLKKKARTEIKKNNKRRRGCTVIECQTQKERKRVTHENKGIFDKLAFINQQENREKQRKDTTCEKWVPKVRSIGG